MFFGGDWVIASVPVSRLESRERDDIRERDAPEIPSPRAR